MNYESVHFAFEPIEGATDVSSLDDLFQHIARWLYDVVAERLAHPVEQDILSCWLAEDIFAPDDELYSNVKDGGMWLGFTRDGAGVGAHWFSVAAAMHRHELAARFEACGYRLTTEFPAPQGQVVFDAPYHIGPYGMAIIEDGQHIVEFAFNDPLDGVLDFGRGLDIKAQDLSAPDRARIEWLHQNKQCGCSLCAQHNVLSDIWPVPSAVEPLMARAKDMVSSLGDVQAVQHKSIVVPARDVMWREGVVHVGVLEGSNESPWFGVSYHDDGRSILAYGPSTCAVWCAGDLTQRGLRRFDEEVIGVRWFGDGDVLVATVSSVWRWSLEADAVELLFVYAKDDERAYAFHLHRDRLVVLSDDHAYNGVWLYDLVTRSVVARFAYDNMDVGWRWVNSDVGSCGLLIGGYGSAPFELSLAASMASYAQVPMDCYVAAWSSSDDLAIGLETEVRLYLSQHERAVSLRTTYRLADEETTYEPWIYLVQWSGDGQTLLVNGFDDEVELGVVTVWDVSSTPARVIGLKTCVVSEGAVAALAPDGDCLVCSDAEGLGVWSV